jgi:diguanylate cyclase (GGDEF)-like protein/PAS domain S-box-containing protein
MKVDENFRPGFSAMPRSAAPGTTGTEQASAHQPANDRPQANRPVAILIAEDSEDDLGLMLRALRLGGFEPTFRRVQTTDDFQAALAQERWDAVLSDFSMPGFTGLDALGILRATGLDIPFILVSGTIGEEIAVQAMKAGASDYIMKQSLARLAPALERELGEAQMRAAHRKAQRDLVESERRLRTVIENEPECVKVVSREGALLEMNAAGLAMLEAGSLAEVQSRPLLEFIVPEHRAAFAALHQRVIDGESGTLRFEVVGLKGGRRWLETHGAPLGDPKAGESMLLGVTRDITESKRAEHELLRFRAAMDVSGDAILLIDRASMRYVDVNQTLCDMTGLTREELIGKTAMEVFGVDRETLEHDYDALIADNRSRANLVVGQYRHKDGSTTPVESRRRALKTDEGWVIVGTARDITERQAAEARIVYLNRVYAMLSGINQLIVRVQQREELFREACRIAVEEGGFPTAWIGVVDPGEMKIVLAASAGASEDLLGILRKRFSMGGTARLGDSLTARAIREKKVLVSNDSSNDPGVWIAHYNAYAGLRSMVILPLIVADEAVGALALYAGELDFFHAEEVNLLTDLAGDIAFAINHIANQERLEYLAYYDELTGLANRSLFLERVTQHMRGVAAGRRRFALFFIDLERFKNINESLGRAAGDSLLKQVASLLVAGEGDRNLVARLGADHFAVVMKEVESEDEVVRFLEDWIGRFQEHPFHLNDAVFRIAMKVGVAMFPKDATDAETLLRNAEAALKKAKSRGERYVFYKPKMTDKRAGKLTLENKLRSALEKEEFVLHYQPKVSLLTGKLTSAEALIRWNDPQTGLVPPGQFIPILEETGLIHDVGRWALRKSLEEYLRWLAAGLPAVRIAVNVSPLQLRDSGFIAEVAQAIGIDPRAPDGLELEITESLIMADVKHSIASLEAIRAMKVTIAIDDFGTGFSSLAYLSKLPVDTLKIDRSFIVDMTTGPNGLSLVSTIINLAHALKLKVVAEGVETDEQSRLLKLLNCDQMQGFLVSRPVPAEVFEAKVLLQISGER